MEGLGAGLSALAFWGFLTAVVVGGIWYGIREREAQYATLQRLIESGQPVDDAIVGKVLGGKGDVEQGLRIAGMITLAAAPGMALLGWALGRTEEKAFVVLLGVAGLVGCVSIGLLVAARMVRKRANAAADRPPFGAR